MAASYERAQHKKLDGSSGCCPDALTPAGRENECSILH
jgi:hypothetical protein